MRKADRALRAVLAKLDRDAALVLQRRWIDNDDLLLAELIDATVLTHAEAAALLTSQWYEEVREAENVAGTFRAEPVKVTDTKAHSLVGWARTEAADAAGLRALILGGVTKRIMSASRDTVALNTSRDSRALGWQRIAQSDGCNFCVMLAGRGAVYRRDTARFSAHDNCNCSATPAFDGRPRPVKPWDAEQTRRKQIEREVYYGRDGKPDWEKTAKRRASKLNTLANDNARLRAWLRANPQ